METAELERRIAELLSQAGKAHHQAFIHTNGDDAEWPLWYAQYLQPKMQERLGKPLTVSDLVYWLVASDRAHAAEAPDSKWPAFYARFFLDHVMK